MVIDVVLADGRKVVREALTVLLQQREDIRVVGDAAEVAGAIKLVRALPVQVVILSAAPRDRRAVDSLLRAAKRRRTRVVVMLLGAQRDGARELLSAGVAGCVTRDAAADELVRAIRTVQAGQVYLSPSLIEEIVSGLGPPSTAPGREPKLSPRERTILQRIARGDATKEIAAELNVSVKTIETHRRRLMIKLDRHSVAELTKYAVLHGLSPLEPTV